MTAGLYLPDRLDAIIDGITASHVPAPGIDDDLRRFLLLVAEILADDVLMPRMSRSISTRRILWINRALAYAYPSPTSPADPPATASPGSGRPRSA